MKISYLLFFLGVLQSYAVSSYAQITQLTIQEENIELGELFNKIEARTDFYFFYNNDQIDRHKRVNIDVKNKTITEILDIVLKNTNINYQVSDKTIILNLKPQPTPIPQQTGKQITGTITDEKGDPIIGANVVEKGTTNGVITDIDGKFSLTVQENAALQITYIGYVAQEIRIGNQTNLSILLREDSQALEEVVVVGYGVQKKVNLTGAVEQITAKELSNKSVANLGHALQGLVPNLNIGFSDGNPSTNASYNIRGGTSFSGNNFSSGSPLILVDGVPMDINDLNPNDIDNISVIKDASAAAIYGARAAFGVILITTKKGDKETAPRISYSFSYQQQRPSSDPGLLNSVEYQEAIMNAMRLDGGSPSADDEYKLQQVKNYFDNPDTAPMYYMNGSAVVWVGNINPWAELMRDKTPMKNHVLSLSGGSARSNYYASFGLRDQDGIVNVAVKDGKKTYNASLGFSTDATDWLNIDTKALYSRSESQVPIGQGGYTTTGIWPFLGMQGWRNLMTPRHTPEDSPVGVQETHTMMNGLSGNVKSVAENLMLKVGATVKIWDDLNFKTDFAYRATRNKNKTFNPVVTRYERSWTTSIREGNSTLAKTSATTDYLVYNAYLDFSRVIKKKHELAFVGGFNQELYKYDNLSAQGLNMLSDNIPVLKLTTGTQTIGDNESHWSIRGAFLRLNYIFDQKYLFEMNGRYDGTSKFPKDSRFKFFPSFSLGWRISEESFMSPIKSIIQNLKLRGSYGSLGNQDVGNYAYIPTYGMTSQINYIINGARPIGVTPPGLVSADLTWETATTIDFGMDMTIFNKLTLNYDWYRRKTKDILTSGGKLPAVLGTNVPNQNMGSMQTTGWEFSARWNDRLKNGLMYGLTFMLSDYQSEITSFSGNPQKLISSLYEGKKMGEIWGYETEGIFQSYEEIEGAPGQSKINGGIWRPGDVRYKNLNGDDEIGYGATTVDDPGDKKIIGNSTPRFQFGLNIDLAWKNFDFNMFWQGTGKRDYWTDSYFYWGLIRGTNINGGSGTKFTYHDSWTSERPNAFFPAFKPATKNMEVQSRYLINAAYARLKNITLGYTLPEHLSRKIYLQNLRVYLSGYNLLTITKVPDVLDPELMSDSYPLMHSYTVGVQITF